MPAPVPQPAAMRLLNGRGEGRDSGGRVVTPPPPFRRVPPKAPEWLSDEAKAEWDRVAPGLARLDLLKEEDRASLTAYCETWSLYKAALADIQKNGLTCENTSTRKDGSSTTWTTKNPAVAIAQTAGQQLRAWAHEFGLTPSAEARVSRPGGDDDDDANPFE